MKLRRMFVLILAGFALFAFTTLTTGCEKDGPAEKAGEKIDNAVEETGEMVEEAGDKVREATE